MELDNIMLTGDLNLNIKLKKKTVTKTKTSEGKSISFYDKRTEQSNYGKT